MISFEDLKAAGLTESEGKIYLALAKFGARKAGRIAQHTGLHRRTVYDALQMLVEKGVVSYIEENGRRVYRAEDPERFIEILDEKKEGMKGIVGELKEIFNKDRGKEWTSFYKGKAGLKSVFEDQLNYGEVKILGASPRAYEVLQFYFKWYDQKRKKKKIKAKIIAQDRKIKKLPLADIRYLPGKYANPVAVNIYGDKVAIIVWGERPMAIVIQSEEVASGYENYFEVMWKVARK